MFPVGRRNVTRGIHQTKTCPVKFFQTCRRLFCFMRCIECDVQAFENIQLRPTRSHFECKKSAADPSRFFRAQQDVASLRRDGGNFRPTHMQQTNNTDSRPYLWMRVKALTPMPMTMPSLTLSPIVAAKVATHMSESPTPKRYRRNGSPKSKNLKMTA